VCEVILCVKEVPRRNGAHLFGQAHTARLSTKLLGPNSHKRTTKPAQMHETYKRQITSTIHMNTH